MKSRPLAERFWAKVEKRGPGDCWPWLGACGGHRGANHGHGQIRTDDGRRTGAHRVSFLLANGFLDLSLEVLHSCDNPICVNPAHLRQGTHAENLAEARLKGRAHNGRFAGRERGSLNPDAVREILSARSTGIKRKELADRFGVSIFTIDAVIQRKNWKHIDPRAA